MQTKMKKRYKYLEGFTFSSCHVRTKEIIGFTAQQWSNNDPLEQRRTAVFFYYPQKPRDRMWAIRGIGDTTGIHCCAVFAPEERWVFVTDDGEVYVVGKGDDDWEGPVNKNEKLYFSNLKAIHHGYAVAVGPNREVYIRKSANNWKKLTDGLFPEGNETNLKYAGFNDVDGFSEKDMYACGGRGDLWHFNGRIWRKIDVPTNSVLENICCAEDGVVYITTNKREMLKGRGEAWEMIQQDLTEEVLEALVNYNGKIIVSTESDLFVVEGNELQPADLGRIPEMNSKAHIASGGGVLVVAGEDEAAMYDGQHWTVILESES